METICFISHKDLAEYMCKHALEGKTLTAALFYEDAKVLLKELACYEDTKLENIEIHEPVYKGYEKEFYITIDNDMCVWAEEAYYEIEKTGFKGYFRFGGDDVIALIGSDANSRIVKAAEGSAHIYEIEINEDVCNKCVEDILDFIFKYVFEE